MFYEGGFAIKRLVFAFALTVIMFAFLAAGCSKNINVRSYNAVCEFYLDGLPKEYEQLPETIRNNLKISVTLTNISSNKIHTIELTDAENYRKSVYLLPGTYEVHNTLISKENLAMFRVETAVKSISVAKNSRTEIPINVSNPSDFINTIKNNQPTDEILNADIFSRKVQYKGKIIDLSNIREVIPFDITNNSSTLAPKETDRIPSSNNSGVSIVVQNQSNEISDSSKATFTGVYFTSNNVVFPKGITLGSNVRDIAHATEGKLGTPDYCLGSVLIGMKLDGTTLVYIDKNSGDRISFYIKPGDSHVSSILYEFAKYE